MANIYVEELIRQAQENKALEEQKTRSQVIEEVNSFMNKWLEDMRSSGENVVRKRITLEEAETTFTSLEIAREVMYGMGLRWRMLPEATRGILWWKRVTRPATLVIYPAKKQQ